MRWIFIALLILMIGCEAPVTPDARICDAPLMDNGDRCCMDQDADGVCDMNETAPIVKDSQNEAAPTAKPETDTSVETPEENPAASSAGGTQSQAEKVSEDHAAARMASLTEYTGDFTNRVHGKVTVILFDSSRTTGAMVAAALNMKLILNDPTKVSYSDQANFGMLSSGDIESLLAKEIILLGNVCNNDLIHEIMGTDDCDSGLSKGTGVIETKMLDGKSITLLLGVDDEDVYFLTKKIAAGTVDYDSAKIEVDVS